MSDIILTGKAWVGGDHIYAFDLIQQEHWASPLDPEENAKWIMAGVDLAFASENAFRRIGYSFVVAGANFAGGGKSIEHPIVGLQGAGIQAVIAESFSRLQFRNAINRGLPFVTCRDISQMVSTGDELEINLNTGLIRNLSTAKEVAGAPLPDFVMRVAKAGGMLAYIRQRIVDGTIDELK
jgi:3-isopropylmalate/(R)-2-methylmalate dehydratase small subunit